MLPKDIPILLAYAVSAFAASNGSKFEGTVDECIEVCDVEPFPKMQKVMVCCIIIQCVGWTNKVCVSVEQRMKSIFPTMKLDPIMLVDCIVLPIGGMANVKLKQEAAIQCARWINRDRIIEGNPSKAPFSCIVGANTVRDKKQTIRSLDNGGCEQMDCRNGWGGMIRCCWRWPCCQNRKFGN
jgi:hypothetical protein